MKNILIQNVGTRNVLVRNFLQSAKGKCNIITTDNYSLAPALYETRKHYVTRRWDEDGYWEEIEKICHQENIGLIVSVLDPELQMLAENRERFASMGILVNTSEKEVIQTTWDKAQMMEWLRKKGYNYIPSYTDYQSAYEALEGKQLCFPLMTKPRCGSGSVGLEIITNRERLKARCSERNDLLIQEYMDGPEIGADIYVDLLNHKTISIFTKKKLKMRSGETDKSVSFKEERLFNLLSSFAEEFGLKGANDIDLFEKDGDYYISEINPRFGGGYIHAYAAGVDFPSLLLNNMNGIANDPNIGDYADDLFMMKYFDITLKKKDQLL